MAAMQSSDAQNMDSLRAEDTMEIGTSPYPHADDVDFEFEPMRDASEDPTNSMEDETIEADDYMQADIIDFRPDDEMVDEEEPALETENTEDLTMDAQDMEEYNEGEQSLQDFNDAASATMLDDGKSVKAADDDTDDYEPEFDEPFREDVSDFDPNTDVPNESLDDGGHEQTTAKDNTADVFEEPKPSDGQQSQGSDGHNTETSSDAHVPTGTRAIDFALVQNTEEQPSSHIGKEEEKSRDDKDASFNGDVKNKSGNVDEQHQPEHAKQEDGEDARSEIRADLHPSEELEISEHPPASVQHDQAERDESRSHYLHPVRLTYLGQEMSLFPPMEEDESATFFLTDTSLAAEDFGKLLAACREVLGESLEHDDEIVLDIPALGLHICEESKYASQLTLSQIIDVYMLLSQNEQISHIEPLHCQLSSRVCLSSQVAYLTQSAREGRMFSEIAAEHTDTPAPEDLVEEPSEQIVGLEDVGESTAEEPDAPGSTDDQTVGQPSTTEQVDEEASSMVKEETQQSETANDQSYAGGIGHEGIGDDVSGESAAHNGDETVMGREEKSLNETIEDRLAADAQIGREDVGNSLGSQSQTQKMEFKDMITTPHADAEITRVHDESIEQPSTAQVEEEESESAAKESDNPEGREEAEGSVTEAGDHSFGPASPEEQLVDDSKHDANPDRTEEEELFPTDEEGEYLGDLNQNGEDDFDQINDDDTLSDLGEADLTESILEQIPPATPSEQTNGKRKHVEDDELDLLDLSTPEPKRTRPS